MTKRGEGDLITFLLVKFAVYELGIFSPKFFPLHTLQSTYIVSFFPMKGYMRRQRKQDEENVCGDEEEEKEGMSQERLVKSCP